MTLINSKMCLVIADLSQLDLEMIQISGDFFEKFVPQQPLPFRNKHEIFIFPPNGKLHTFQC